MSTMEVGLAIGPAVGGVDVCRSDAFEFADDSAADIERAFADDSAADIERAWAGTVVVWQDGRARAIDAIRDRGPAGATWWAKVAGRATGRRRRIEVVWRELDGYGVREVRIALEEMCWRNPDVYGARFLGDEEELVFGENLESYLSVLRRCNRIDSLFLLLLLPPSRRLPRQLRVVSATSSLDRIAGIVLGILILPMMLIALVQMAGSLQMVARWAAAPGSERLASVASIVSASLALLAVFWTVHKWTGLPDRDWRDIAALPEDDWAASRVAFEEDAAPP